MEQLAPTPGSYQRPGDTAAPATDEPDVRFKIDGRVYDLRLSDLSASDAAAVRAETGMALRNVLDAVVNGDDDGDLDLIAIVMWLARRKAGEPKLTYRQVADELGYDIEFEKIDADESEDVDSPLL